MLIGKTPFTPQRINVPATCSALAELGCCGAVFVSAVESLATLSCHAETVQWVQDLAAECSPALPQACTFWQQPPPTVALGACGTGAGMPPPTRADCGIPDGYCPTTTCQLLCAAVTADPPPGTAEAAEAEAAPAPAPGPEPGQSGDGEFAVTDAESPAPAPVPAVAPAVAAAAVATAATAPAAAVAPAAFTSTTPEPPFWIGGTVPASGSPTAVAAEYITTCLEAFSPEAISPGCEDGYNALEQIAIQLMTDPSAMPAAGISALKGLCAQPPGSAGSCMAQYKASIGAYSGLVNQLNANGTFGAAGTKAVGGGCDASIDPLTAKLVGATADFLCLKDGDGELCAPSIAAALQSAGLLDIIRSPATFNYTALDTSALCSVLSAAGCCGKSFELALADVLALTCHPGKAQQLMRAAATCSPKLPAVCTAYHYLQLTPAQIANMERCAPVTIPQTCHIPAGSCPTTSCQMLCAIATLDPPAGAPGLPGGGPPAIKIRGAPVGPGALAAAAQAAAAVEGGGGGAAAAAGAARGGAAAGAAGGVGAGAKAGARASAKPHAVTAATAGVAGAAKQHPGAAGGAAAEARATAASRAEERQWVRSGAHGVGSSEWPRDGLHQAVQLNVAALIAAVLATNAVFSLATWRRTAEIGFMQSPVRERLYLALLAFAVVSGAVSSCRVPGLCFRGWNVHVAMPLRLLGLALGDAAAVWYVWAHVALFMHGAKPPLSAEEALSAANGALECPQSPKGAGAGDSSGVELVTRGPYAFVRHPQLAGALALIAALALATGDALVVVALGLMWGVAFSRVNAEEQELYALFGERYTEYRAGTGMLLPGFGMGRGGSGIPGVVFRADPAESIPLHASAGVVWKEQPGLPGANKGSNPRLG